MDSDQGLLDQLPSEEVRTIQAQLYQTLMKQTCSVQLLQKHKQYLDTDIKIVVCDDCAVGSDFELTTNDSSTPDDRIEQHVELIQAGYCTCGHITDTSKTKVYGLRLIHRAVRKDINLPLLAFLHGNNCDLNSATLKHNVTPLLIAIRENQLETVKYLIQKGANVNKSDSGAVGAVSHIAPLSLAIQLENEEIVKTLLAVKDIDVNCIDRWNQPLLVSCVRLHPEYVEMLLEAGADPNIPGTRGNSVLLYSAHIGDTELVKLLIKHGADVNKINDRKECAILPSIYRDDVTLARVLLDAGADPNYRTPEDQNSLILLASYDGSNEMIKMLIRYGGNPALSNHLAYTALHIAAWNGHTDSVKTLLEAGVPHDKQTKDLNTPLALSAHGGHLEVMKILLPLGCNVNNADKDKDTPLHYAAYNGMTGGVQLLLEYGADPDITNHINTSVLWNAVYMKHKEVVKQLLVANVEMEISSVGIDQHAQSDDVVFVYDVPRSPLFVAVENQSPEIALLLITAGYNIYKEKWLLEGDIPERDGNEKLISILKHYIQTPQRLMANCRNYFRRYFGLKVFPKVEKLDIPCSLKNYLTLKDLAEDVRKQNMDSH